MLSPSGYEFVVVLIALDVCDAALEAWTWSEKIGSRMGRLPAPSR